MAQAPEPVASENKVTTAPEARDAGGHWTPETLFEAQLLPLPAPTASLEELTSETPAPQEEEQIPAQVIDNGAFAPEESEVPPDLADKLFSDARPPVDEGPVAEAAGRSGAYFSSSRLVPEDARFAYPYRANGKLFFQKPDGRNFICSGAVIKPRLVLTAGHCVHSGSGGPNGFYRKFLFVPAYHRGQAPYQAWNFRWVVTTGSWATSNDNVPNKADFAIIEVEDRKFSNNVRKIGEVVGWLGFRTNALSPNHTKKIGYPGNHDRGDVMHQVDSRSFKKAAADTVLYGSDMRGGSSGGSWIENFGVKAQGQQGALFSSPNRVVGVTSYGYVDTDPKVQGSSILNDEFIKILNQACAHRPGNC
jgi:V8-like Glu-specific endopeptidase